MPAVLPEQISILIERFEELWLAQCIEYDLATIAPSLDELHEEIRVMLRAHIAACNEEGVEPFHLRPAPLEFHERFDRATLIVSHRSVLRTLVSVPENSLQLPRIECRILA